MKKIIGTIVFALTLCSTHALAQRSDASLPECNVDQSEQICDVLFRRLNKLQKKGSPEAATLLALFYLSGEYGLPQDTQKGVKLLERAARKRSSVAQYELAKRYLLGQDVEHDQAKALMLMKKAAIMDYADAEAIYNVLMLEQATSEEEKAEYLAAVNAIEFGKLHDGAHFLGKYFYRVNNHEQARKFLSIAAQKGHQPAREMLLEAYPQAPIPAPEVSNDEVDEDVERITVAGASPDVNEAAREVIEVAMKNPAYRGKKSGSRIPGRGCEYDRTCYMLDMDSDPNGEFRLFLMTLRMRGI